MLRRLLATRDDLLPFIARITLGGVVFPHGAQKLFGWFGGKGFEETMQFFTMWGFPPVLVLLLIATEAIGTLALIAGFAGRVWAAAIGVVMIVAVFKAHARHFFMNWYAEPRGEGFEYHLLALGLVAIVLTAGSGRWSIDRRIVNC
ncbi:MAG: DoxX family protein [Acidobacteriota bacterium]|nr:DoxX family protein [Acidobacteriota bacterium]